MELHEAHKDSQAGLEAAWERDTRCTLYTQLLEITTPSAPRDAQGGIWGVCAGTGVGLMFLWVPPDSGYSVIPSKAPVQF